MTHWIAVLILTAAVIACSHAQSESSETTVNTTSDIQLDLSQVNNNELQVDAMPVGQGDCTIITCPNGNIVVLDCGSSGGNRLSPQQIQNALGNRINQVVAIIISHPDSDHFNYLYDINWNPQSIRAVIIGGALNDYNRPTSPRFVAIYNWLLRFNNMNKLATVHSSLDGGLKCIGTCTTEITTTGSPFQTNFCDNQNIQFDILAANVGPSSNEKSIVMKASVNNWSMLLPGDIEGTAADTIATYPTVRQQLRSFVYKIAHHGASSRANSVTWLQPIVPQQAFASSGYNFGLCRHPRCETINRLTNLGTITMSSPHAFYCGNPRGFLPIATQYNDYRLSILETSPRSDTICKLTYTSAGMYYYNCNIVLQTLNELDEELESDDEDCPEELMENTGSNGTLCASVTNYSVHLILLFLVTAFMY